MAEKKPISSYLEKPPTELQARFAAYLKEEVGYDPSKAKTKEEAFADGVRLSTALRMIFQASDFNRVGRAAAKAEREAEAAAKATEKPAETAKPAKTTKPAAKATAAKTTKPAAKSSPKATPAATPAKAPSAVRRARSAPAPSSPAEAPF